MVSENTFCPVAFYSLTGLSFEVHKSTFYRVHVPKLDTAREFQKQLAAPHFLATPEKNITTPEKGCPGG
jgi:hypothetical protein